MNKDELKEKKKFIRNEIRKRNKILSKEYMVMADEKIQKYLINMKEYLNSQVIFCFVSTEEEVNTIPIIKNALENKKIIVVPKCISAGIMEAYIINSLDDLEIGKYNILEPKKHCKLINPKEIDFAIIPCVTCNYKGHRLGHGGGYYDRYLENLKARKVIICRDKITYDDIPLDEHDINMDILITEKGIHKLKKVTYW